ncbi:MAG: hypothetical protein V2A72_01490 [Candidatus Omnitrophota bacterium]
MNNSRRAPIVLSQKIAMLIIVVFSLSASVRLFSYAVDFNGADIKNNNISRYESRFSEIRKMLASEKVVGYITEKTPEEITADANATAEYFLTQYAISPTVVDNKKFDGLVVGNLHSGYLSGNASTKKLSLIKNFGNGVMLLKSVGESE